MKEGHNREPKSRIYNMEVDQSSSATDQDLGLHILSKAAVRDSIGVTSLTKGVCIRIDQNPEVAVSLIPASLHN